MGGDRGPDHRQWACDHQSNPQIWFIPGHTLIVICAFNNCELSGPRHCALPASEVRLHPSSPWALPSFLRCHPPLRAISLLPTCATVLPTASPSSLWITHPSSWKASPSSPKGSTLLPVPPSLSVAYSRALCPYPLAQKLPECHP